MPITKETRDEDGKLHSFNDEPAIVYDSGSMYWYQHGKRHRETNAAFIYHNGYKEYYFNGIIYPFEYWLKLTPLPEEDKLVLLLER
jgi:hypothetical protein